MKLKETKIHIGGLMRCCLETIESINPDIELENGFILENVWELSSFIFIFNHKEE